MAGSVTRDPLNHWAALWRIVTRVEREKLAPWLAVRNALGVSLPLILGILIGNPGGGLVVAIGALNVCFSDGDDPYRQRARRMLTSSAVVGLAVFVGALSARNNLSAVVVAAIWAFVAGILVAVGQAAADIGVVSLVTLVVFAGQTFTPGKAASLGALAFAGGLLQTALALSLWPVRRYEPERRAIGNLYAELAETATAQIEINSPPPASSQSAQAHAWIVSLSGDHSIQRERYRLLLSEADRIQLCLLALGRLRIRIEREAEGLPQSRLLIRVLELSSALLGYVAGCLLAGEPASVPEPINELSTLSEELRRHKSQELSPLAAAMFRDAVYQVDSLAGQLRAAVDLAASATQGGLDDFEQREASKPWALRLSGTVATIRANLSLESAACRHAVRLAACLALGDAIGRALEWRRAYWLPMTIAIVLKPDFQSTFSRGVLRLAGTFAGLAFATALSQLLSPGLWIQIVLVAMFVFILRCFGPANYGIFVAAVSALVVSLVAITGVAPSQVIAARALNTCAGGALALVVYWIWPTWERTQVADVMARMLDAYRAYFRAVSQAYLQPGASFEFELNRTRQEARLARSNLEASVDRLSAEPGDSGQLAGAFTAMLASSHRLVHALMALEAGLSPGRSVAEPEPFRRFANDVEMSLYLIGAVLRGSPIVAGDLPNLREAHRDLIQSLGSPGERFLLVNVETDRITNSLNTLREQVFACTDAAATESDVQAPAGK